MNKVLNIDSDISYYNNYDTKNNEVINTINIIATDGNYSYDKVINSECNKDCKKHIISKSETCLVESYNSSIRDTFARFRRRTKCYSKSLKMVYYSMLMWSNIYLLKELLINSIFI